MGPLEVQRIPLLHKDTFGLARNPMRIYCSLYAMPNIMLHFNILRFFADIWIVGTSIVYWAHRRAIVRPIGSNLSFDKQAARISWLGRRGMKWNNLIPYIRARVQTICPPQVLVIQLGSNDLTDTGGRQLCAKIEQDIIALSLQFPRTTLVWSELLPRIEWRGALSKVVLGGEV